MKPIRGAITRLFLLMALLTGSSKVLCADANEMELREGWKIQAAAESGPGAEWYPATVPTTVLSALVQDGVYKDIYLGKNLESIPKGRFAGAWKYRNEFAVATEQAGGCAEMVFEGINYRANIVLNGARVAGSDTTFGAFRLFRFDLTGKLKAGTNVLEVEVFPPKPGDFTMGFVDWNPKPPDANMGLFRPVKLHFYHDVGLRNAFVESKIDHESWSKAELTVSAEVENHSEREVQATIDGDIGGAKFNEKIKLAAKEKRLVKLTASEHPQLKLENARLWWPWELGEPNLYTLSLTARVVDEIADSQKVRFGIREVRDYKTKEGARGYRVNGKRILIRGGGWADELLLHEDRKNLVAQMRYTKAMNLNTVRLEGVWGSSQQLYDLADENGLLVMVGWSCQWEWADYLGKKCDKKYGGFTSEADMQLATNYLHDQVVWLRNHPGIFVWVLGSDMLPKPELERRYDAMLLELDPARPSLKSCGTVKSEVSGPSGVKMNGPYDYVTPNYWYEDKQNGGAFGFNTETGPGPQPPPMETLKRMFPAEKQWPINEVWNYHCGRGEFGNITRYMNAFNHRYGEASGVEDFAFRSQAASYEAMRPMYEAFSVNLPKTTGIVQWMLNASWPKLYWQLYDYYLVPGSSYFGAKKGAAPLNVVYNYANKGVYLVNLRDRAAGSFRTTVTVYDADSKVIQQQVVTNEAAVFGSVKVADVSTIQSSTSVYFVDLKSESVASPEIAVDNFYWLSTKPDVLDEDKSEWYVTPNKSFADLSGLNKLPKAELRSSLKVSGNGDAREVEVTLSNESDKLAFFIEAKLVDGKSGEILTPVLWSDNYVSIPPHGSKTLRAKLWDVPAGVSPELKIQGWNLKQATAQAGL